MPKRKARLLEEEQIWKTLNQRQHEEEEYRKERLLMSDGR
jgi:hypothetical protein